MRKFLYLLLAINSVALFAQTRIQFTYDSEGNQTQRIICLGCDERTAKDSIIKPETIVKEDMIEDAVYNTISYYPNPVTEELYVRWVNEKEYHVASIELFSQTGQSLQRYPNVKGNDIQTIPFFNYASGFYHVVLLYSNGEKKTLKVVKK